MSEKFMKIKLSPLEDNVTKDYQLHQGMFFAIPVSIFCLGKRRLVFYNPNSKAE